MKSIWKTAGVLAVLLFTSGFFSCKSYSPSFEVDKFYSNYNEKVEFVDSDSYTVLMPKNADPSFVPEAGIIFYPGGLVDYHSYIPLLTRCAEKGVACFIVEMPMDFAFMDKKAAGKFPKLHPEIKKWYIAGHSLGGAMAGSFVSRHTKEFEGLILLAAYSTHDISSSDLKVLSIYGANDGVLNKDTYQKNKKNLPPVGKGLTEIIIEGGNHSQFASYGSQEGDFTASITAEEQQKITVDEILNWAGIK